MQAKASTDSSIVSVINLSTITDELCRSGRETGSEITKMLIDTSEKAKGEYEFIIVEYKYK